MITKIFIPTPRDFSGQINQIFTLAAWERCVSYNMPTDTLLAFNYFVTTLAEEEHFNIYSPLRLEDLQVNHLINLITQVRPIKFFVAAANEKEAREKVSRFAPGFGEDEKAAIWLDKEAEIKSFSCPFMLGEKGQILCRGENFAGKCGHVSLEQFRWLFPSFCSFVHL